MKFLRYSLAYSFLFFSFTLLAQVKPIEDKVQLSDMIVDGKHDEAAQKLIAEVIRTQKDNSPKSLKEYEFKSYSKILSKVDYDDVPDFKPKTKKDSSEIKAYQESIRAHEGLIEKGMIYAYQQSKGEKEITDAIRISGIQTPLLEIAAIDPLPYAFDQDEFNFFYFRSFINPLSRKGLQHYKYKIQDTIILNNRETIEVSFHNIESQEKPLYGSLYIDAEDKALAEFYAEYKRDQNKYGSGGIQVMVGNVGESKYYLTSKYKKIHHAWFPISQEYYGLKKIKYHIDSTQQVVKNYYKTSIIYAEVSFLNHKTTLDLDENKFKGYKNDISKEAFTEFNQRIDSYRTHDLTDIEKETYVVLDSLGKKENVNKIIRYGRFFVNGFNLPLGQVDLYLPSLYGYNGYEGVRLGLQLQTNNNFHSRIGLEGGGYYGFDDKKFKYMMGANYLLEEHKNSVLGIRYIDDIMSYARLISPLRTGMNYLRESFINGENENYIHSQQFKMYGKTTFFENLDFLSSVSIDKEKSLIPYAFNNFKTNKTYKQLELDFFLRYSPNNEYLAMPYGRIPIKSGSPNFYLTGDFHSPLEDNGYDNLRLKASVDHQFSWFNKTAHVLISGGKVFGEAPLWGTFNQGLRGKGSWFKPWRLGSSNNFETMLANQFYSEQFVMAQWRQEWLNIGKKTPIYTVIRGIYGDFDRKALHQNIDFDTLSKGYFEGGIEIRRILLNAFGLGVYYRFGAYKTHSFEDNFALKLTLDLPFGNIVF